MSVIISYVERKMITDILMGDHKTRTSCILQVRDFELMNPQFFL